MAKEWGQRQNAKKDAVTWKLELKFSRWKKERMREKKKEGKTEKGQKYIWEIIEIKDRKKDNREE